MDEATKDAIAVILRLRARKMLEGADVHVDAAPGMRKKRVQPKGRRPCLGECGKLVSANKSHCEACSV